MIRLFVNIIWMDKILKNVLDVVIFFVLYMENVYVGFVYYLLDVLILYEFFSMWGG